jgi:hypothetical protein
VSESASFLPAGQQSKKECKSWSFRLRGVAGNKPLPKLWEGAIVQRVSDLLRQIQVEVEIVDRNEAKAENLLRFD